jgi:hypothetical protein
MKSKTYTIAWGGAIKNCIHISQQLNGKVDHKFFNVSASPELTEHWERKEDVRYYTHFFNAVNDFLETDAEVFIFSAGDGKYGDYAGYTKYIEQVFSENPNLVAFAPNSTNDDWSGERSHIRPSTKYTNLYLSTCTNGVYFALSREVCVVLNNFYQWSSVDSKLIESEKMLSGWGIDIAIAAYAIYNNKYCYRDNGVELIHPVSNNYNKARAHDESQIMIKGFSMFLQASMGYDLDRYNKIILNMGKLFRQPRSLTFQDFYDKPEEVENA